MQKNITIYCDFDGTITQQDAVDYLLENLASPEWLDLEARWKEGEIGSRECLSKQIPLIKGGWNAVNNLIGEIKVDPFFKSFSNYCNKKNISLYIVSEGLERVIETILEREEISVTEIWSNKLEINKTGDFTLGFPYPPESKNCTLGLCKCQILGNDSSKNLKVVIGDGLNDICWAKNADLVFAKSKLLNHCNSNNIPCIPFNNFSKINSILKKMLEEDISIIAGELVKNPKQKNHARKNK